ncbi:MAG: hypothetical protein ACPG77_10910 [Nannocystaceae bacterium]
MIITTCLCLAACGDSGSDSETDVSTTAETAGTDETTSETAGTDETTDETAGTDETTDATTDETTDATTDETTDATTDETTDETTDTTTAGEMGNGIPEGLSTWSGEAELQDIPFAIEASIVNTQGDLMVTVTLENEDFGVSGEYALTGTHEPTAGLIALAPEDWIVPTDPVIELVGVLGSYDPEAQEISGMLVDYAKGTENYLEGGPLTLKLVEGAGAPTVVGDTSAALTEGSQLFVGTSKCTSDPRDAEATLVYDGAGGVDGVIKLGDPDFANPLGTFTVSGVHNPSTGASPWSPGCGRSGTKASSRSSSTAPSSQGRAPSTATSAQT